MTRWQDSYDVKPQVRANVVLRAVGDELVVYDPESHRAHCLNRTAAVVFRAADGRNSVEQIAEALAASTGLAEDGAMVWSALERLAAAELLDTCPSAPANPSRRSMLRRVGLGAIALAPIVTSLVVPTPAEALVTCIPAAACTTSDAGQPCFVLAQNECLTKICTGSAAGDCQ